MRISISAICAAFLFAAPAAAQNAGPGVPTAPVTGVIQSFDGKVLMIKTADGSAVAAALGRQCVGKGCIGETEYDVPANVLVMAQLPGDVSMLKPGAKANMNIAKPPEGSTSAVRVALTP